MVKVRSLEATIPKIYQSVKAGVSTLIPAPESYEKTLPPFAKVLATHDQLNFKNYGGLSEAYFFAGNRKRGETLYALFSANAKSVLGPEDTYHAGVGGDMAFFYFYDKNYSKAEPLLLGAIKQLETHLTPPVANSLVFDYSLMSLILEKEGKTAEASSYAKKYVDLEKKQQENPL